MTLRIRDFGNGYVEEIVSPTVGLYWNHKNNTGSAHFGMLRICTMNGDIRAEQEAGRMEHMINTADPKVFLIPKMDKWGQPILDENEEIQLEEISEVQIMAIHKAVFDSLYNEYNTSGIQLEESVDGPS